MKRLVIIVWIALAVVFVVFVVVNCGSNKLTSYAGLSGQLKVVNNTNLDAGVQRRKCGAETWGDVTTVKSGKSKEWSLDAGCFDLKAYSPEGDFWAMQSVYVSDGQRTTVWVEW